MVLNHGRMKPTYMKKQIVFIILCLVSVTVHATSDRDEFISRLMSFCRVGILLLVR